MTDPLKPLREQIAYLQKREAKLTRDLAAANKRVKLVFHRCKQLHDSLRRGLPHMNLDPFLDRLSDDDAIE